jgi:hypothetical protein
MHAGTYFCSARQPCTISVSSASHLLQEAHTVLYVLLSRQEFATRETRTDAKTWFHLRLLPSRRHGMDCKNKKTAVSSAVIAVVCCMAMCYCIVAVLAARYATLSDGGCDGRENRSRRRRNIFVVATNDIYLAGHGQQCERSQRKERAERPQQRQ